MLHFRASGAECEVEVHLDVLQQMARELDVSDIGGMVLRVDVYFRVSIHETSAAGLYRNR